MVEGTKGPYRYAVRSSIALSSGLSADSSHFLGYCAQKKMSIELIAMFLFSKEKIFHTRTPTRHLQNQGLMSISSR